MISHLRAWWRALARRERATIAAGGAIFVAAILYAVAIEPAWVTRAKVTRELPELRAQLSEMEALREEVRLLRQQGFGTGSVDALKTAAEQSLGRSGISGIVRAEGERAIVVNAEAVPAGNWFAWMEQFGRDARLRVARARVARAASPGLVNAEAAFEVPAR